jgi:hypothetical protein
MCRLGRAQMTKYEERGKKIETHKRKAIFFFFPPFLLLTTKLLLFVLSFIRPIVGASTVPLFVANKLVSPKPGQKS